MKRTIVTVILAAIAILGVNAQNISLGDTLVIPEGFTMVDSIVYVQAATYDSTLSGQNIFDVLSSENTQAKVKVNQDPAIRDAMNRHIKSNKDKTLSGYRVRIFFDNKQASRNDSEETLKKFLSGHPGIPAYRSFVYPFFKVTVGDFRSRSEAMQLLQEIVDEFPTAFVVKENINYPVVDKEHSFVTDTLHIIREL